MQLYYMPKRVIVGLAVAGLLVTACSTSGTTSPGPTAAGTASPPATATDRAPSAGMVRTVPVPAGVEASLPAFTADGDHLLFAYTAPDVTGSQIGTVALDGRDFRCVTCGLEGPVDLGKPFVSRDGTRVLVRTPSGKGTPTTMYTYSIVSCADGVLTCTRPELVPVALPGEAQGVLQTRELRIAPDGEHLAFTQARPGGWTIVLGRLERQGERFEVTDLRLLNPPFSLGEDSADWAAAGAFAEVKGFTDDGRSVIYATTAYGSLNFDDVLLDLATGERRRLTAHPDWDEPLDVSPDGGTFVVGSSRGTHRIDGLSLVPRPPMFDLVAYAQSARWLLSTEARDCVVRPWLLDASRPDTGQPGTELDTEAWAEGYGPRAIPTWRLDGTAIALWEELQDPQAAGPDAPATRLRVVTFDDRTPTEVRPAATTPEPTWAWTYDQYPLTERTTDTIIRGRAGGTAHLVFTGDFVTGTYQVTYDGYTDDGSTVLDGTETFDSPMVISDATYTVDLTVSGARPGSMRGSYALHGKELTGTVTSTLGDETASWPPAPCPPPTGAR